MTGRTASRGALVLGVFAIALCSAQEPVVVRLRDAIGDTVDLAERDSLHLFPNTIGFHDAVILALPGPEFFAEITRTGPGSAGNIFLRIMPYDLERIRALIDNHEYVAEQQRSDSTYARSLASFWQKIEDKPLRNMAGDPAIAREPAPTPAEQAPPIQPQTGPVVVHLSDAVGDTIDLAERDSFRLFPNTAGFQHAVILALPGPDYYAEVSLVSGTAGRVFFRILPGDLQRIRFLVNNREYVDGQKQSDSTVVQNLASFWQTIEEKPLRSIAGEPATPQDEDHPLPPEAEAAGQPQAESAAAVVRLNDVVGDTIDEAERDRYHLFPYTRGFRHAVFLTLPGPKFLAEVTRIDDDSVGQVYYPLLPGQLERIRFLVDSRPYVPPRVRSREAQALMAFWRGIQERPLKDIAAEPAAAQDIEPPPVDTATAREPELQTATGENRYNYMLHGATLGSIAGGFLGSLVSVRRATVYNYGYPRSYYGVSEPVLLATSCGVTALGSYAGYRHGNSLDRNARSSLPLRKEGTGWRTCCAIGACLPGLPLGIATTALLGGTMYGITHSGDTETGTSVLRWIPAVLSGLCVTVEIVTLGYQMGRSIDQNQAR
jgi:hypothetical protein